MQKLDLQTRKIITVGTSSALVLPPDALWHIHAAKGDHLIIDKSHPDYLVLSKAIVPPYMIKPIDPATTKE